MMPARRTHNATRFRLGCLLVLAVSASAQPGRRLALVIGMSAYDDQVGRLPHALNDAEAVGGALAKAGFGVTELEDATRGELLGGLKEFSAKINRGDMVLVYYAGHGVQANGLNYVLPLDFNLSSDLETRAVRLDRVIQQVGDRFPKLKIFVIDACRNNPLGSRQTAGLAEMQAASYGAGTYIAMSAAPNQTAMDGLFAPKFAAALSTPGLSLGDVFIQVRKAVLSESGNRQNPFSTDVQVERFYFSEPKLPGPKRTFWGVAIGSGDARRNIEIAMSDMGELIPNRILAGLGASERNSVDFPPSQVLRILDRSFSEERSSSCYLAVQFTIGFRLESLPEPNGLGQTREDRASRGSECLVNDREDAELKAVDKAIGSLRAQLGL